MKEQDYHAEVVCLQQEMDDNLGKHPEAVIAAGKSLIELAEREGDAKQVGITCYGLAETYYSLNETDAFFQYAIKGLQVQQDNEQWDLAAQTLNLLAVTAMYQGNASFAINYFILGLEYCEANALELIAGGMYLNISALYMQYEEYSRAISYIRKGLDCFKNHPEVEAFEHSMIAGHVLMGDCYLSIGALAQAEECRDAIRAYHEPQEAVLQIPVGVLETGIASKRGDEAALERAIKKVMELLLRPDALSMDIFDDVFSFCIILLNRKRYVELTRALQYLDHLAEKSQLIFLQIRTLAIWARYYLRINRKDDFYEVTGRYYVLQEEQRKAECAVIQSLLDTRLSVESLEKQQLEMEKTNRILRQKSEMDPLTGLPNRFRLNEYSEEAFEQAYRAREGYAIEILDVDFFKEYNDTYGHSAGDDCLYAVSEVLKSVCEEDRIFAARYGGDEFMMVYTHMTKEEVRDVAETIQQRIKDLKLYHGKSPVASFVTISQGIYYGVPEPGNKAWDFLHASDMALYQVKRSTKNAICLEDKHLEPFRE